MLYFKVDDDRFRINGKKLKVSRRSAGELSADDLREPGSLEGGLGYRTISVTGAAPTRRFWVGGDWEIAGDLFADARFDRKIALDQVRTLDADAALTGKWNANGKAVTTGTGNTLLCGYATVISDASQNDFIWGGRNRLTVTVDAELDLTALYRLGEGYPMDIINCGVVQSVIDSGGTQRAISGTADVDFAMTATGRASLVRSGSKLLAGYRTAELDQSRVTGLVGGNLTVRAVVAAAGGDIAVVESRDGFSIGLQGDVSADLMLTAAGKATLRGSSVRAAAGYFELAAAQSSVAYGVGGSLKLKAGIGTDFEFREFMKVSAETGREATEFDIPAIADLDLSLRAAGRAMLTDGDSKFIAGYSRVTTLRHAGGVFLGGNLRLTGDASLTGQGVVDDTVKNRTLDWQGGLSAALSLQSTGSLTAAEKSEVRGAVGYQTLTLEDNAASGNAICAGGNWTAALQLDAEVGEDGHLHHSGIRLDSELTGTLSLSLRSVGRASISRSAAGPAAEADGTAHLLGYQSAAVRGTRAGLLLGGTIQATADVKLDSVGIDTGRFDDFDWNPASFFKFVGTLRNDLELTGFASLKSSGTLTLQDAAVSPAAAR